MNLTITYQIDKYCNVTAILGYLNLTLRQIDNCRFLFEQIDAYLDQQDFITNYLNDKYKLKIMKVKIIFIIFKTKTNFYFRQEFGDYWGPDASCYTHIP